MGWHAFYDSPRVRCFKIGQKCVSPKIIPSFLWFDLLTEETYSIINAGFEDTMRSSIWAGRPLRALATPYIRNWELNRRDVIEKLQGQGLTVLDHELDRLAREGKLTDEIEDQSTQRNVHHVPFHIEILLTLLQANGVRCSDGKYAGSICA